MPDKLNHKLVKIEKALGGDGQVPAVEDKLGWHLDKIEELIEEGGGGDEPVTAADIDSEEATEGQVLTADGEGGAHWVDAGAGTPFTYAEDQGQVTESYGSNLLRTTTSTQQDFSNVASISGFGANTGYNQHKITVKGNLELSNTTFDENSGRLVLNSSYWSSRAPTVEMKGRASLGLKDKEFNSQIFTFNSAGMFAVIGTSEGEGNQKGNTYLANSSGAGNFFIKGYSQSIKNYIYSAYNGSDTYEGDPGSSSSINNSYYLASNKFVMSTVTNGYNSVTDPVASGDTISDTGLINAFTKHLPVTLNNKLWHYQGFESNDIYYQNSVIDDGDISLEVLSFNTTTNEITFTELSTGGGSGLDVVTLSTTSGTLSDDDFAKVSSDSCIIVQGDNQYVKAESTSSDITYSSVKSNQYNATIKYVTITKSSKAFTASSRYYDKVATKTVYSDGWPSTHVSMLGISNTNYYIDPSLQYNAKIYCSISSADLATLISDGYLEVNSFASGLPSNLWQPTWVVLQFGIGNNTELITFYRNSGINNVRYGQLLYNDGTHDYLLRFFLTPGVICKIKSELIH